MGNFKQVVDNRRVAETSFDQSGLIKDLNDQSRHTDGVMGGSPALEGLGVESFGELSGDRQDAVRDIYQGLHDVASQNGIDHLNTSLGTEDATRVTSNQIAAATLASLASADESNYKRAMRSMREAPQSSNPNVISVDPMLSGPAGDIQALDMSSGLENYNEKATRDFRVISVAYNLAASRQDAFGEAIYPTVVVNPTEGGVTQNLTYAAVMQDVYHSVSGDLFDTREVNMVEAFRDPTVLEDRANKIIPIVDDQDRNSDAFVADSVVAHEDIEVMPGQEGKTAPLAFGKRFDLMGISNRQQLVSSNLLDVTDTIDPALRLKNIYVRKGSGKILKFRVERMPTAVFQPNLAGDSRRANLNFDTEDLVLTGETSYVDGSTDSDLDTIKDNNWTVRLAVTASGNVSLSRGDTWLTATDALVHEIYDEDGKVMSKSSGSSGTLADNLGNMEVIGYDLEARFTNTNRRERGQLVQTRTLQFRYPIPMLSPITLPISTMDEGGPNDVVTTLTVATNIRNSINAVTRLLNYSAQLRETVSAGLDRPKFGAIEGALSAMIRPTYRYQQLDLRDSIDTIRSKDRYSDVCETILNTIRAMLYPAYRDSNIEAAYQTVTGNADEKPMFIIATDKEIANYLMTKGDDRTMGSQFKFKIVSTNNEDFDGKVMVLPTRENPVENDILNFGQFYYVPTIVADMPISRNGQTSREIAAVPFNLHVNNIPFMIELDVTGLAEVMGESQYNSLPGFQYAGDGSTDDGSTGDAT